MHLAKSLLAVCIVASLTACGGGSSSESPAPTPSLAPPPTPTVGVTEGVISGFGSVYVNGQRYQTGNANITIGNNTNANESALKMGMKVRVVSSSDDDSDDPEATEIQYEEHLVGPISFIDNGTSSLTVLGQTVLFDDLTEIDLEGQVALAIGQTVEISGYINQDGNFYATFIEVEANESEYKLKGNVANLDTALKKFTIGELTIDYSSASFDDMQTSDLADGLYVDVEGTQFDTESMTLVAIEVENKDVDLDDDTDEVNIAGIVSGYDSEQGSFNVNQYTFVIDSNTEFDDGSIDDLADGVFVKVEAEYINEQLVAEEIEFKERDANGKTEGMVAAIDEQAQTFEINGLTFTVDEDTQYEDNSDLDERRFTFDDIAVNDWLKVIANEDEQGNLVALKIKRINENDRDGEVKGAINEATVNGFTVAGVNVIFTDDTDFETENGDITLEQFVAYVTDNRPVFVEVEGEYDGNILVADEVEIDQPSENHDDDDNPSSDRGKAEFEGVIESIDGDTVVVAGKSLRFQQNSELKIDDVEVSLEEFLAALTVGLVIEVEGVWQQDIILVTEAEIELEEDDDGGDD